MALMLGENRSLTAKKVLRALGSARLFAIILYGVFCGLPYSQ